jgi:hypothetical protein
METNVFLALQPHASLRSPSHPPNFLSLLTLSRNQYCLDILKVFDVPNNFSFYHEKMESTRLPSDAALFIVMTPSAPSIELNRKIIRSHVMRGKNRKKPPPRPAPWINKEDTSTPSTRFGNHALSIAPRVGGDFSFTAAPADLGPQFLAIVWKRKQTNPVTNTLKID